MKIEIEIPKSLYNIMNCVDIELANLHRDYLLSQHGFYNFRELGTEYCIWVDDLNKGYVGFESSVQTVTLNGIGYLELQRMEECGITIVECGEFHHLYDAKVTVINDEIFKKYNAINTEVDNYDYVMEY